MLVSNSDMTFLTSLFVILIPDINGIGSGVFGVTAPESSRVELIAKVSANNSALAEGKTAAKPSKE